MSTNGMIKMRYISDIRDGYLKKGEVYEVSRLDANPSLVAYVDNYGEYYAVPAIRFEEVTE